MRPLLCGAVLVCAAFAGPAAAEDTQSTSVKIVGHVVKPAKIEPTPERLAALKLPENFKIEVFADGLINPRILAMSDDGTLYATRRTVGDVIMLKDGDGKAEMVKTVASRPGMHGIAIDGSKVYLVTNNDIYVADIKTDGQFSAISSGSSTSPTPVSTPTAPSKSAPTACSISASARPAMRARSRAPRARRCSRSSRTEARGGFSHPACAIPSATPGSLRPASSTAPITASTGWRRRAAGRDQPDQRGQRLWLAVYYADGGRHPQREPPGEITHEDWAEATEAPVLTYTAHAAPMQMAFYAGSQFPEEYQGDALNAMRGSWNRNPPSGYEVVRVAFEDGKPQSVEPFITGFLVEDGKNGYGYLGRPVGLAVGKDGSLFVADDFALDTMLDLKPGAARKDVLDAMKGYVLAHGAIVGVFKKPALEGDGS
jgi:glucose/arabinose dehydrogenase